MKKEERVIYLNNEEINKIIELLKDYSFEELKKTEHYEDSLLIKGTD